MLSVLIPARNEFLLKRTIDSVLSAATGEIEVIAVLDGYWPDPAIPDDDRVILIHHKSIGQRAAVNEAARIAKGKYILKTDGHSIFDSGFDEKLAADCEYDWTVIPRMYNLHAFDWVCKNGHRFYQDKYRLKEISKCPECGEILKLEYVWEKRQHKKTDFMYMDNTLKVQYWSKYPKRKESEGDIVDIMNGVGACWFQYKDRFWELGGLDEKHGSWGQVGVEVACKAWLSGGRHVVNKRTWFAHTFRTTKEFTFPYKVSVKQQDEARQYSRDLWLNDKWPKAKRKFQWLIDKFAPVPSWPEKMAHPIHVPAEGTTLSVIIPARNEIFLQKTIDNLQENLVTDYEIIVGLDDYWPKPPLKKDKRVRIVHSDSRIGMRPMINKMVNAASGKYIMRLDAHCIVAKGIDAELIKTYRPGDTVLAMRYELKSSNWTRREKTDCPYRYLSHPDVDPTGGLRGLAWPEYEKEHEKEKIGETMTISGSNWLMEKEQFSGWGGLDEKHGTFGQEGVEISCMTWLSGGRVLVNKNTWYAHWNRGRSPYALSMKQKDKSNEYSMKLWMGDNWPLAKRKFSWLIEKFKPVPGWNMEYRYICGNRLKVYSVDELYDNYLEYSDVNKRSLDNPRGAYQLYETITPFIKSVLKDETYTDDELRELPYFDYLVKHLNPVVRDPLVKRGIRHVIKKMRDTEWLCKDIRDKGLQSPLDMWKNCNGNILQRGNRRVIILKQLGIKSVPVRVFNDEKLFKDRINLLDKRSGGRIEAVAVNQFIKYSWRATDKYWRHNYTYYYDRHLNGRYEDKLKILEIGIKRGASLLMWKEAFPKAQVFGIDVNDVSGEKMIRGHKDLNLLTGNQGDRSFLKKVSNYGKFDLIVDDGSHDPKDLLKSMINLWPSVAKGGMYVMEDIWSSGKHKNNRDGLMKVLKSKIDSVCQEELVMAAFYPNICFLQKT